MFISNKTVKNRENIEIFLNYGHFCVFMIYPKEMISTGSTVSHENLTCDNTHTGVRQGVPRARLECLCF